MQTRCKGLLVRNNKSIASFHSKKTDSQELLITDNLLSDSEDEIKSRIPSGANNSVRAENNLHANKTYENISEEDGDNGTQENLAAKIVDNLTIKSFDIHTIEDSVSEDSGKGTEEREVEENFRPRCHNIPVIKKELTKAQIKVLIKDILRNDEKFNKLVREKFCKLKKRISTEDAPLKVLEGQDKVGRSRFFQPGPGTPDKSVRKLSFGLKRESHLCQKDLDLSKLVAEKRKQRSLSRGLKTSQEIQLSRRSTRTKNRLRENSQFRHQKSFSPDNNFTILQKSNCSSQKINYLNSFRSRSRSLSLDQDIDLRSRNSFQEKIDLFQSYSSPKLYPPTLGISNDFYPGNRKPPLSPKTSKKNELASSDIADAMTMAKKIIRDKVNSNNDRRPSSPTRSDKSSLILNLANYADRKMLLSNRTFENEQLVHFQNQSKKCQKKNEILKEKREKIGKAIKKEGSRRRQRELPIKTIAKSIKTKIQDNGIVSTSTTDIDEGFEDSETNFLNLPPYDMPFRRTSSSNQNSLNGNSCSLAAMSRSTSSINSGSHCFNENFTYNNNSDQNRNFYDQVTKVKMENLDQVTAYLLNKKKNVYRFRNASMESRKKVRSPSQRTIQKTGNQKLVKKNDGTSKCMGYDIIRHDNSILVRDDMFGGLSCYL